MELANKNACGHDDNNGAKVMSRPVRTTPNHHLCCFDALNVETDAP